MTSAATTPFRGAESKSVLAARDSRAPGDLYDRFGPIAYSLAFSITQTQATAERIVTAAFAATCRQFERDPGLGLGFFATLMTSVRASAIANRSDEHRSPVAFKNLGGRQGAGSTELAVARALGDLPDAQQHVLALAYFGGLGVADMAAELQQPMSDVTASLQAALRHLRGVLAEYSSAMVPV